MNVRAVVQVAVAAATMAACGRGVETGSESRSGSPATSASSSSTTSASGRDDPVLIAYSFEQDVWLYDGRSGRVERLTSDGFKRTDHSPRFRDGGRLTFVSMSANKDDSSLVEVDLAAGTRRDLLRLDGALWAYEWTDDGATLVYLASAAGDQPGGFTFAHELRRVAADGTATTLRRFDGLAGRGTFVDYDEVHVDWSPDGSTLLLVDTHLDVRPDDQNTVFVLAPDGTDVAAPRPGTWARWAGDTGTVVYVDDVGAVRTLDTAAGSTTALPVTGPARRLAVSPDGRLLAFDDGAADPTVVVYDLGRRTGQPVARHAVGPLWLSPDTLAAGHATPCHPTDPATCDAGGHGAPWAEPGDGWRIDVTAGTVETFPVASTLDAAVASAGD